MNASADFLVHELAPDVSVRVTHAMRALPFEIDARVEMLWQRACRRVAEGGAGRLFNGRVFSADQITTREITGHMTEFRRIVAQMDDHALGPVLGVRPLAVCGVVHGPGGVVMGRRPAAAVYQPGMWQLPPAGSVDSDALRPDDVIDLAGQVLTELQEELGLPAHAVTPPRPICIVEHPGSRVSDLGMAMTTTLEADAVRAAHRANGNGEYDPLLIVPDAELAGFVAQAGQGLVPPAREFLFRLGLLPYGLSPPAGP